MAKPAGSTSSPSRIAPSEARDDEIRELGRRGRPSAWRRRPAAISSRMPLGYDTTPRRQRAAAGQGGLEQPDRLDGADHRRDLGLAQDGAELGQRPRAVRRPAAVSGRLLSTTAGRLGRGLAPPDRCGEVEQEAEPTAHEGRDGQRPDPAPRTRRAHRRCGRTSPPSASSRHPTRRRRRRVRRGRTRRSTSRSDSRDRSGGNRARRTPRARGGTRSRSNPSHTCSPCSSMRPWTPRLLAALAAEPPAALVHGHLSLVAALGGAQ